ncbi:TPA: ASCH domain-containing protein [Vibrio parahaemolyticus]
MIIQGIEVNKGLIIDTPWIDLILDGKKCWEMRSTGTQYRGHVALIKKGTGNIVGLSVLVDSLPSLPDKELMSFYHNHQVNYAERPDLIKWNTPWVLNETKRIEPIPYTHPRGAVIWVNLP